MVLQRPFYHLTNTLFGQQLIESSAGTGKTHAITCLYIRLLIELALPVREILVVTFTEAATAELKKRIREKIREGLEVLDGASTIDPFLAGLYSKIANRDEAKANLLNAVSTFDEAAIFTIHGFCQQVLRDKAFESGSSFDAELITSQEHLLREIVEDFYRRELYSVSPLFLQSNFVKDLNVASMVKFVKSFVSNPFRFIIPKVQKPPDKDFEGLGENLSKAYQKTQKCWGEEREEICALLEKDKGLDRRTFSKPHLQGWLKSLGEYFSSEYPYPLPPALERFGLIKLKEATKNGHPAPEHQFFEFCQKLIDSSDSLGALCKSYSLALKNELVAFARNELQERKRRENVRSFDDLLLDLYGALQEKDCTELVSSVRAQYKAVLIDEFQDTDPIQMAIFETLYGTEDFSFFRIGDPKQSIYGFRGADVYAYLNAAQRVQDQFTLGENWRSSQRLITATNTLFERAIHPFVLPEIQFQPVRAGRPEADQGLSWNGTPDPSPMKLWFVKRESVGQGTTIPKGKAHDILPEAVARDIVSVLNAGQAGECRVDDRPVSPEDIAILVRTNREARLIQDALNKKTVPCVLYSQESVFDSDEAGEIERILTGIAELGDPGKVKAALATNILGAKGSDINRLNEDESQLEIVLQRFEDYRELWLERGFMVMARRLLDREFVRRRLLEFPDGERRLTNVLHCLELLHAASLENNLGIDGILKWLKGRRLKEEEISPEEYQLRLETDECSVKVITIHRSKGLQYPIVYCPFGWNTVSEPKAFVSFHDPENPTRFLCDIDPEQSPAHEELARREVLGENARLLYVALTRAKYRCTLVWGAFKDAGSSPLAYLLHAPELDLSHFPVDTLQQKVEAMDDDQIEQELAALVQQSSNSIEVRGLPDLSNETYRPPVAVQQNVDFREFAGAIRRDFGIASFTSLVQGKRRGVELPDHDSAAQSKEEAVESPKVESSSRTSFAHFPRGTRAGKFLHKVLEGVDFKQSTRGSIQSLVQELLEEFGFDLDWEGAVTGMVQNVLNTPLDRAKPDLVLSRISARERLNEMEFNMPLDLLTSGKLRFILKSHLGKGFPNVTWGMLDKLDFSPVSGFMKGFIDLVFYFQGRYYLVDWKSTFLGGDFTDYATERLTESMWREGYILQYLLYVVALHRYLRFRIKDYQYSTHFGGVFYLFLRGVNAQRGSEFGIYKALPDESLVRALSDGLSSV